MPADMTQPSRSRRTALKGAAVGVGFVWVAPLVQVVTMDSASAASGSPGGVLGRGGSQGGNGEGPGTGHGPRGKGHGAGGTPQ